MKDIWKNWTEVKKLCKNKRIVFFGKSEDWIHKTIRKLPHKPDYIIDSNLGYEGTTVGDLKVYAPDKLIADNKDEVYIIITAGPYESVVEQLESYNLEPGKHFCCTPEYMDFRLIHEIHEYDKRVLVASSDYSEKKNHRYSKAGGGLYVYDIKSRSIEKKVPGHFRQIVQIGNYIYALEYVEMKLYVVSLDFKVLEKLPLDRPNTCGIDYSSKRNAIYITNAATDIISIYDKDKFKLIDEIKFSNKFDKQGVGQHHINDMCIVEDSLYVSYFSYSGNWKRGVMDGGVSEIDLDDLGKAPNPLVRDLWMPHSVKFLDGNLAYLDSMRGNFCIGNQKIAGRFPGFVRGLTYDDRFYYIGQSEDMYMSRLFGVSDNIMLNAGFFIFDLDTKVSRFYSFMDLINIHDLLILPA